MVTIGYIYIYYMAIWLIYVYKGNFWKLFGVAIEIS
jgi:hypothetical protein